MAPGDAGRALITAMAVAVLALSACDTGVGAGREPIPTPEPGQAPGLDRAREDDAAAEEADEPLTDDDPAVNACDEQEFADVDGTIGEQLDAFADDDWEHAYGLASEDYRRGVTADAFVALIEEHFPAVADPAGHTSTECLTDGTRASILVTVTGRAGTSHTYLYVLALEDGGWRVNGATASAAPEPGGV